MRTALLHFFLRRAKRQVEYLMGCRVRIGRVRIWVGTASSGGYNVSEAVGDLLATPVGVGTRKHTHTVQCFDATSDFVWGVPKEGSTSTTLKLQYVLYCNFDVAVGYNRQDALLRLRLPPQCVLT
jgi:hypothetical protein